MKCFQVLGSVVLIASAASAGAVYGTTYGTTYGASYGVAAPAVSYGVAHAAPAVSYGVAHAAPAVSYAAPLATRTVSVAHAAPSLALAAPAVSVAAAPVVHHSAPSVRSHEIHTGGAGNTVRVEEYKAGGQVIRVHDSAQRPTEVINVQGPAAAGNHIRVVSRSGPTHVERAVFQDPSTQVFDVVNPPKPADRVINIRGAPAPPARVELVAEQQHAAPEVTVGGDVPNVQVVRGGVAAVAAAPVLAAPAAVHTTVHAAPAVSATYHAAPVAATYATGAVTSYAAPAVSYAAPAVSYAAPAVSYAAPAVSYGSTYGYGYHSTGYGNSVVLRKA